MIPKFLLPQKNCLLRREVYVRELSLMMKRTSKEIKGKRKILPTLLNGDLLRLKTVPMMWISPLPVFQEVRPRLHLLILVECVRRLVQNGESFIFFLFLLFFFFFFFRATLYRVLR